MKRRSRITDEYRSLDRQESRVYSVPCSDTFQLYRVKAQADINPLTTGAADLLLDDPTSPYYVDTTKPLDLFNTSPASAIPSGTELFAIWHPTAGLYMPIAGAGGGASRLCKATDQLEARADDDSPSMNTVQPVKYDSGSGNWINDGGTIQVQSWVNAASANPAEDPKGFIYVWVEQGTDGQWYWTGEDCPIIDPGDPIQEQPGGGTIQGNSNTIIVT